jgi:hypothetical protein
LSGHFPHSEYSGKYKQCTQGTTEIFHSFGILTARKINASEKLEFETAILLALSCQISSHNVLFIPKNTPYTRANVMVHRLLGGGLIITSPEDEYENVRTLIWT